MASLIPLDERRSYIVLNDEEAVAYAAKHFIQTAEESIRTHGQFVVALSGGNTPKAIFHELLNYKKALDWSRVKLFWSDERAVLPTHPDSNYKMAMDAAFGELVSPGNIFRMFAERELETEAREYEALIKSHCTAFDLVMLGMGDDGHTASLFPHSKALDIEGPLVTPNWIESKKSWRMTLTYDGIHRSRAIVLYVLGQNKAEMVQKVLKGPYDYHTYPSQKIGTASHKALWLLDKSAAASL